MSFLREMKKWPKVCVAARVITRITPPPTLKLCFHHAQHISEPSCEIVHINQWLKTSHWQCTFACLKHVSLLWCMISDASSVCASVFENSQHGIINYILFYKLIFFSPQFSFQSADCALLKCKKHYLKLCTITLNVNWSVPWRVSMFLCEGSSSHSWVLKYASFRWPEVNLLCYSQTSETWHLRKVAQPKTKS